MLAFTGSFLKPKHVPHGTSEWPRSKVLHEPLLACSVEADVRTFLSHLGGQGNP